MKKRESVFFFLTMCSVFLFSLSAQSQLADRIALGREGGTTRSARMMDRSFDIQPAEPVVEAHNSQEMVYISVQNYRGGTWVEILGQRGAVQSYFEVHNMGFEVVRLSGLRSGKYTLRVTLGAEVYIGTFKKGPNGG